MLKLKFAIFLTVSFLSMMGIYFFEMRKYPMNVNSDYKDEIESFRQQAEIRLKAPEGWLSVVGLSWLKEGQNFIGSDVKNQILLPKSAPAQLGSIEFTVAKGASIIFKTISGVLHDDTPVVAESTYPLSDDTTDKPSKIKMDSVSFNIIKRKNGYGVRVRDTESSARKNFKGRNWYPPKKNFIIDAQWIAFEKPVPILVPDILGNLNEELSPGYAQFQIDGQNVELHPIAEDGQLFFVFRDQTSGKETYGAARFLYADMPKDGRVILDFNKAVNPPCAFTEYATCPMPPKENITQAAIRAGELIK